MNIYLVNYRTLQEVPHHATVAAKAEEDVPRLLDNHHYTGCWERFDHIETEHCQMTLIGTDSNPDCQARVIESRAVS